MLTSGISLKPEYFEAALGDQARAASGLWFEAHPENYMVAGGPRLHWLEKIRNHHPLSFHGVGASLGGVAPLSSTHLASFRALVDRFEPSLVSEHLAWSYHEGQYFPDLLPVLRTQESLNQFASRVHQLQEALGRSVAIENPTHYLDISGHEYSEPQFLRELVARTGCSLLLDLNNVFVSANNLAIDATSYLDDFPLEAVREIHLAGCTEDPIQGKQLLIDSHNCAVAEPVWALYEQVIEKYGPIPTLIERDADLPPFFMLMKERDRANALLLKTPQRARNAGQRSPQALQRAAV